MVTGLRRGGLSRTISRTIGVALAAALALGSGACSDDGSKDPLEAARARGTLRVAMTQASPPWSFLDESNQPVGYDVDIANELARRLDIAKVEFVASDFQSFIEGVKAGRFDMVISGQTITDERKKEVDFSRPYEVNGVSIFVNDGNAAIKGVDDLRGKAIGVSEGTTQADFVRENIPGAQVKPYKNATLALTDLSRDRIDAALFSRFVGTYLADKNSIQVKPTGELLNSEVNGMSFRKGSTAFEQEVDKAIGEMIADGTLTKISRKWLGGLDMAGELRKLPASQNG